MTAPLKADQQAADRLLKAGVREAVSVMRRGLYGPKGERRVEADHRLIATNVLAVAGSAAALLLDERPAKKAAARKGAS